MHKLATCLTTLGAFWATATLAASDFETSFRDKTMRLDYFHTCDHGREIIALDRVVSDGPWSGSRTQTIDPLNLGTYLFSVFDAATNTMIYSRGFSSIYAEWVTVPASKTEVHTFHESLRFPWPRSTVKVTLESRDANNHFRPVWSTTIDPDSRFVNPSDVPARGVVWPILESGPPREKVDLLILGDGYDASEITKFHSDAEHLVEVLFSYEPFASRRADFNVWAIDLPGEVSGVSRPRAGSFRRSPLSVSYNIFDSERYALTYDNRTLREVASAAPYEFLEILINEDQYGGGGIYGDQSTVSVGSGSAEYVFVHEFGHHFAALADEYYTSSVSYETGRTDRPEPWEPNITALGDPTQVKWGELVAANTPLPTPWNKSTYDDTSRSFQATRQQLRSQNVPESRMDELFAEVKSWATPFLAGQTYSGEVGAFEGAGYESTGLYRPELDCLMFTRNDVGFCRVCSHAIERVIDLYSRP